MNTKLIKLLSLFLVLHFNILAQESTNAAGGNNSGVGGNVSYSVGQIVYTTHSSTAGSVSQGVQQTYKITTALPENLSYQLQLYAYPNPTNSDLNLEIINGDMQNIFYQLTDLNGKIIATQKIKTKTEKIEMKNLAASTYFLKVYNTTNAIQIFKIIKN
jgi:hypothetical protein